MNLEQAAQAAETLSPDDIKNLLMGFYQQRQDIKQIKETIYMLLQKFGFMNADGTFRENLSVKSILAAVMKASMHPKQFEKDMAFLIAMVPLMEKYKDL